VRPVDHRAAGKDIERDNVLVLFCSQAILQSIELKHKSASVPVMFQNGAEATFGLRA